MRQSNAAMRLVTMLVAFLATALAAAMSDDVADTTRKIQTRLERMLPAKGEGQSATQLADGTWLLAGGLDGKGRVSAGLSRVDHDFRPLAPVSTELTNARSHHTATMLADGSVLFIGGVNDARQPIATLERFHPGTSEVEVIGDIGLQARSRHSATLLTDGRILIVGGLDISALVRRDAQLLDPRTWRVEQAPTQLADERYGHDAALLPSDDVLLWQGRNQDQARVDSVELYRRELAKFSRVESIDRILARPYSTMMPAVAGSLPAANASDVSVDPQLAVRFTKPLAVETLNSDTVTLLGPGGPVDVRVVGAESGQLLFVTPKQQLLPGTSYTLFVKGATDAADRQLPFTALQFTTRSFAATQHHPTPTQPLFHVEERLDDRDGELWLPLQRNFSGGWRSGNGNKLPRQLPKRAALSRALYGKNVKDNAPVVPQGVTALAGQVLRLDSTPLPNVTLTIGNRNVTTDANGEFLLSNIAAGVQTLVMDGTTAGHGRRQYGRYEYRAVIEPRKLNTLPFVIWMTRLDSQNEATIPAPTPAEFVLSNPRIPGLELRVPKDTVIRDAQGKIVTEISMTAIPVDQPPFPLPNSFVPVYFTIQPGGAHLQGLNAQASKGARLIYPNYSNARPGERMDFWNYDSREKGWYIYGQGTVSADAKQIVPDPGVVIYEFSGAMIALPGEAPPNGPPPGDGSCGGGAGGGGGPPPPPDSGPSQAGDPVDCYTGLFLHKRIDLQVSDVIPLEVLRTYRQNDTAARTFGIGTSLGYDIFLVGDLNPYTYQELILPDGARIRYERTSPGTSWTDAVYASSTAPGQFFGSTLQWDTAIGSGWLLRLKNGTEYSFPEAAMLSARCNAPRRMRDRYGNALTFTRGPSCRLSTVTSTHGRHLNFSYDTSNRVTQVSDDTGRAVTYGYDTAGRLTTVTYPDSTTELYSYDTSHRMLTVTDRRGHTMVTNVYDANGRVAQQTYADGTSSTFSYTLDSNSKVTQMDYTDERDIVRRIQFNAAGFPTSITRALGELEQQVVSFVRSPATNLVERRTDALGRMSTYQYDAKGNITRITHLEGTPGATTWSYTYEPTFNQLASVTDPMNRTVTFGHDASGNVTSTTDALGNLTTFAYEPNGQLLSTTGYLGSTPITTRYLYRGGVLSAVEDPLGRRTEFFADRVGRVVGIKDAAGNGRRFTYDGLDRLLQSTDELGHSTVRTYDGNGNLLTFTDERGGTTHFGYDARNRISSKTDPLSGVENYVYDEIGNRTRVTDRKGQVTGYEFDALNRLKTAGFGATVANATAFGSTVTYSWDAGDRITGAIDSVSGSIALAFDGLDRLTQEQNPQGRIDYTYYANGLRQTMTVQGQPSVNYVYDDAGRVTQISQGTATVGIGYDSMNRRSTLTLPNGIEVSYGYDDASQLTSLVYRDGVGASLGDLIYGYDAAGRRISMGGTFARVTLPEALLSTSHDVANRQTIWGTHALAYDDNGALATNTDQTLVSYLWDERQRLKEIKQGGVTTTSFEYDAFNRRTRRVTNGVGTNYLNDRWQVVQELSGTTPIANLLTGLQPDEVFRRTSGSVTEDFLTDALGNTIALTNAAGSIQTTYSYEAYGATSVSGATSSNAHQYTGRENDGELYYYRNRYYSSTLRRFISEDPIGFAAGSNIYAYVQGNPLSYNDPFGLAPSTPKPGQTCIDGVGLGCYGDQDNPGKPGTPNPPKERKRKKCVDTTPNYASCHACCSTVNGQSASGIGSVCFEECQRRAGMLSCPAEGNEDDAGAF